MLHLWLFKIICLLKDLATLRSKKHFQLKINFNVKILLKVCTTNNKLDLGTISDQQKGIKRNEIK